MLRYSAILLLLIGCGRSPLEGGCPLGFALSEDGDCACLSNGACHPGMQCLDGTCRCLTDECCPEGFTFLASTSTEADACICMSDVCCPEGMTFDGEQCACTSDVCCPPDHAWDE